MAYIRQNEVVSSHQKGNRGEDIACKFLVNKGFDITDRNYRKVWGEIDIIAKKDKTIHFFEVKSVTADFEKINKGHKPEDNVHGLKIRHIRRMVETYLVEKCDGWDTEFSFHVLCVYLDMEKRKARVKWIRDIIL